VGVRTCSSSTVPRSSLGSSVPLTVSDGVDKKEGVTESESDDSVSKVKNESEECESDNDSVVIGEKENVITYETSPASEM